MRSSGREAVESVTIATLTRAGYRCRPRRLVTGTVDGRSV